MFHALKKLGHIETNVAACTFTTFSFSFYTEQSLKFLMPQ